MSRRRGKSGLRKTKEAFIGRKTFFSVFGLPILILLVVFVVVKLIMMMAA